MVFLRYCDGASFSGNNASTYPISGTELHFRGHHILNAAMDDLLNNRGLDQATDVVVSRSAPAFHDACNQAPGCQLCPWSNH
jgi:hypothetical protein